MGITHSLLIIAASSQMISLASLMRHLVCVATVYKSCLVFAGRCNLIESCKLEVLHRLNITPVGTLAKRAIGIANS